MKQVGNWMLVRAEYSLTQQQYFNRQPQPIATFLIVAQFSLNLPILLTKFFQIFCLDSFQK